MREQDKPGDSPHAPRSWNLAFEMLRAVLAGATYESVAARYDVSGPAVERRIKAAAIRLTVGADRKLSHF